MRFTSRGSSPSHHHHRKYPGGYGVINFVAEELQLPTQFYLAAKAIVFVVMEMGVRDGVGVGVPDPDH